uniref:60S ribosomal protein L13a n=1 Tax=Globodera pallida TaxID=36090 RepID=A0A183CMU2_GLOPA
MFKYWSDEPRGMGKIELNNFMSKLCRHYGKTRIILLRVILKVVTVKNSPGIERYNLQKWTAVAGIAKRGKTAIQMKKQFRRLGINEAHYAIPALPIEPPIEPSCALKSAHNSFFVLLMIGTF